MKITWYNLLEQIRIIKDSISKSSETITTITASNLPAVDAVYADLAAARTSVNAQNVAVELRLDAIDAKINEMITKLRTAGVIAI